MRKVSFLVFVSVLLMVSGCLNTEGNNEMEPEDPPYEEQNGEQNKEQSEDNQSDKQEDSDQKEADKEEPLNEVKESEQEDNVDQKEADKGENDADKERNADLEIVADRIVSALAEKDMETLGNLVHPSKGVRFSPYAHVKVDEDLVFTDVQVKEFKDDDSVYFWGSFDGSGHPIEKSFAEYYERFIYDLDYLNAEKKSVDERLGQGNTIDNSADVYPDATVVEYYFSGFDPQYEGMDWRSLRLVLEKEAGQWYLVGIIHDEWTI